MLKIFSLNQSFAKNDLRPPIGGKIKNYKKKFTQNLTNLALINCVTFSKMTFNLQKFLGNLEFYFSAEVL